ncbi:MAG TPA: UvrB/UvrC motif-containing protein, partial [Chitinophagales bacterium]|nr:UvrB/UvrC motif-containing protein [Chitinophagales bacterium]
NVRSLTQTAGRAARNANGLVIMYADKITDSMRKTIDETDRRRSRQIAYNTNHNITPTTVFKSKEQILEQTSVLNIKENAKVYAEPEDRLPSLAADPVVQYMSKAQLEKAIEAAKKDMQKAAKALDFIEAARLRDEMYALQQVFKDKFGDK